MSLARRTRWLFSLCGISAQSILQLQSRKDLYEEYTRLHSSYTKETIELIQKDIRRTALLDRTDNREESSKAIARILYLYSITNKTIDYVQGMNIICAVIYLVINNCPGDQNVFSESLTYFCFFNLMVDLGDLYSQRMDMSSIGIHAQTRKILQIISIKDSRLFRRITEIRLLDEYAIHLRWLLLMFAGELNLSDTLLVWDECLKYSPRHYYLPYLCAAVFLKRKKTILSHSISEILPVLQTFDIPIHKLIKSANKLVQELGE
ncbi:TBC1 domain family member 13 [Nematocida sp. AWRm80]|nr:TBC1 domain family member 13 [Nematocida sp. AWRm80]